MAGVGNGCNSHFFFFFLQIYSLFLQQKLVLSAGHYTAMQMTKFAIATLHFPIPGFVLFLSTLNGSFNKSDSGIVLVYITIIAKSSDITQ